MHVSWQTVVFFLHILEPGTPSQLSLSSPAWESGVHASVGTGGLVSLLTGEAGMRRAVDARKDVGTYGK